MKRLWETELENGSRTLRLGTLDELGGAQTIVKTHVDRALSDLEPHERETALDVFRYLVTPSGTKIALSAVDLVALRRGQHEPRARGSRDAARANVERRYPHSPSRPAGPRW